MEERTIYITIICLLITLILIYFAFKLETWCGISNFEEFKASCNFLFAIICLWPWPPRYGCCTKKFWFDEYYGVCTYGFYCNPVYGLFTYNYLKGLLGFVSCCGSNPESTTNRTNNISTQTEIEINSTELDDNVNQV